MGHVYVEAEFEGTKGTKVVSALVDTGATYTVIPEELSQEIGVVETPWVDKVHVADGHVLEAKRMAARVRIMDRASAVWVLVMDTPEILIGVTTLEALGFKVDPMTERLEPSRGFIARA